MVYIPTKKLPNNDFWLSFHLAKNIEFFSNVRTKNMYITDTEVEANITFGSFFCHKETEIFIDSSANDSFQINGLIIKDIENTVIDLSFNQYTKIEDLEVIHTKHIQGKLIRFSADRYIEFFGISFYSKSLDGIPLSVTKNQKEITQKLTGLFDLLFTNQKIKYSQIYYRSFNVYQTILKSSNLQAQNFVVEKNDDYENLHFYDKLIDEALAKNIFKYKDLIQEFNLHEQRAIRYFQTHKGHSFYQYFLKKKIIFGYELMNKGDTTISDIAQLMGYKSHYNLANQIRRIYGRNAFKNKEVLFQK